MADAIGTPRAVGRVVAAGLALAVLAASGPLAAHGSMESPVSRVYACYQENPERPSSPACIAAAAASKQALYDWNGVRIGDADGRHQALIPDGALCSAGDGTFSALDAPRDDWPATPIAPNAEGTLDLSFRATAPHATAYFRLYVTEPGYDPTQPLDWLTLEAQPFCELTGANIVQNGGRFALNCPFPSGRSGRHLIYAIWQRSDSPEAFYSCSDVVIGDEVVDPGNGALQDLGGVIANTDLAAGSRVTFRLFDATGGDVESIDILVDELTGARTEWPFALATEVNVQSSLVTIGQRDEMGVVTPKPSATENHVFVAQSGGFSFVIDVKAPDPEPEGVWSATVIYVAGDRVSHEGIDYEAKWWTLGDLPGASAPWRRLTPVDGPLLWNAGAVYLGGDEVIYEGVVYRARWWTQGEVPTASEVWEAAG